MSVSVIGLGFVGGSMKKSFEMKGVEVIGYDKFKDEFKDNFMACLKSDIAFLALPTVFDEEKSDEYQVESPQSVRRLGMFGGTNYVGSPGFLQSSCLGSRFSGFVL